MVAFAIKLHFKEEVFRSRMDASCEEPRVEDLRRLARTAWPELVHQDFRIFYVDDDGDSCPLIEESWADVVTLSCERPQAEEEKEVDRRLKLYLKLRCDESSKREGTAASVVKVDTSNVESGEPTGCSIEDGVITVRNISAGQAPVTVMLCPCSLMKRMRDKKCEEGGSCCEGEESHGDRDPSCPAGSSCQTETSWVVKHTTDSEGDGLTDHECSEEGDD
ncbi:hypothetical protein FOZ61_002895 [Perkinsus olseni]|uniref:PB1 domain-containing protein n=1 Tax=Perkinsus olseni TaxID=32597 RepID=A0A7J6LS88_PEROL|nr:hypothetical protein FOZ61_002895 [Perkinsus olseni]KAF4668529.1 hypothetical protein FOL46_001934 [Perkinsus olseni]